MKLDFAAFLSMLPLALEGWLGVIVVIGCIALVVYGFHAAFSRRK